MLGGYLWQMVFRRMKLVRICGRLLTTTEPRLLEL